MVMDKYAGLRRRLHQEDMENFRTSLIKLNSSIQYLCGRVDTLQILLDKYIAAHGSVHALAGGPTKTPYRCPVCSGSGKVHRSSIASIASDVVECRSCKGEGVLWR